jgi:hypothetical protein
MSKLLKYSYSFFEGFFFWGMDLGVGQNLKLVSICDFKKCDLKITILKSAI